MARQNEIECLEKLKDAFRDKTKTEIYANCELEKITRFLFAAKPNKNSNEFPDFVFNDGGIEHFQITSSRETRKGSSFQIESTLNQQTIDKYYLESSKAFFGSPIVPGVIIIDTYKTTYDHFNYEYFLNSLERNIINHVESLEKSGYQQKTVVFIMEQQTARMYIDDGRIPIAFYELHRDKKALTIIKDHCKYVNYIIYYVADSIEIIDLSLINELLFKSIVYKDVKGGKLKKNQSDLFINI